MQPKRRHLAGLRGHQYPGKLITLPIASAMPSASSQPPLLRVEARVMKTRNTARNATTVIRPSASSKATRTVAIPESCR